MSKHNNERPNVVIVGIGGGGARAAYRLTQSLDTTKFNLVVINPRPYYVLYPTTARLVVSDKDDLKEKVFIPIESILKGKGRFVQGTATKVEPGKESGGTVVVDNGETIPYRTLILSPGVSWDNPLAFPESPDQLETYLTVNRQAFEKAKDILLVGAGAVGAEMAGEIKDIWPEKNVTIAHGAPLPLNDAYPDKYRNAVRKDLEARNINLLLNEYVDIIPAQDEEVAEVTTRSGKTVKADLVISSRGQRPNTEIFTESFGHGTLTSRGLVKVEPTLQLPGHQDIFVIGDVIDWDEQKQVFKAQRHADVAVANVLAMINGQAGNLKQYKGSPELIILVNGRNAGVTYIGFFGGIVLGNWFTRLVKSKSLIISLQRDRKSVV